MLTCSSVEQLNSLTVDSGTVKRLRDELLRGLKLLKGKTVEVVKRCHS